MTAKTALPRRELLRSFTLLLLASEPTEGSRLRRQLELAGLESESGGLYRLLCRLEREGYVGSYSSGEGGGPGGRVYRLTARGVAQLKGDAQAIEDVQELLGSFSSEYAKLVEPEEGKGSAPAAATESSRTGGVPRTDSPRLQAGADEEAPGTSIDDLGLSSRVADCLRGAGVRTLEEIAVLTDWELRRQGLRVRDIGQVVAVLAGRGLSLRGGNLGSADRSARAHALAEPSPERGSPALRDHQATLRRSERDAAIVTARAQGDTLQAIGNRFGLSRERVRQIVAGANAGELSSSSSARTGQRSAAAEERREQAPAIEEPASGYLLDTPASGSWTPAELRSELDRFGGDLHAADLSESTIEGYLSAARLLVGWLDGSYAPGPPQDRAASATADPRTGDLVAMSAAGATLAEAARAYGISPARVRQILKQAGTHPEGPPGGAPHTQCGRPFALPPEFGPVVEAMWREGMLYHEIASVFDTSAGAVHRLIYERVPTIEQAAQTQERLRDRRSSSERTEAGLRRAATALASTGAADRRHAQTVIDRWLAARDDPPARGPNAASPSRPLSEADLGGELERFEAALGAAGLRESTIHNYMRRSSVFVRWLTGDYVPGADGRQAR